MKKSNFILGFLILLVSSITLFFSRQIFFYKYEPEYYEHYYYHSQWNIANSTRGISDADLYKFVGYRLIQGENPFNINYEVPPFGKLLFGLAERYIGNPYWVNIFLYLLSIGALGLLAKDLFKENKIILITLLLFVSTPMIATELKDTMLDLPLMALLLIHILLFNKYLSNRKLNYLIISGIFLGLFTGTKVGIYTPLIGILGIIMILISTKNKIKYCLIYFSSVFAGYVFSYIDYFLKHPNPIPWLRLHIKPITFYLNSNIPVDHLNQWKTIFFNIYQGWWNPGKIIRLDNWSLILPIGVIALIIVFTIAIKKNKKEWIYISGLTSIFLLINSFIGFWPRYLIPIIPLFILLIIHLIKKNNIIIFLIIILNSFFLIKAITIDRLPESVQNIATLISTRAYRDLYRNLTPSNITEENFINKNELIWDQLKIRNVEVITSDISKSGKYATVKYKIKYITKYGDLIENPTLNFIFIKNKWKLDWSYNYILNNYDQLNKFIIEKEKVSSKNSISLVSVYIVPQLMSDWGKSIGSLSALIGQDGTQIDKQIKTVVPDQYPQFAGYLNPKLGDNGIELALSTHGVSVDPPDMFLNQNGKYYVKAKIYLEDHQGKKTQLLLQIPN